MSINSSLSQYFARELEALGFEPDTRTQNWVGPKGRSGSYQTPTIYWSLSHCQGDGMAWEGRLDVDVLANRLMSGKEKAAVKRAIQKGEVYEARLTHSGNYYHWNSMDVSLSLCDEDACTAFERQSWANFVEAVESDVQETSRRLEKEGYAFLENCNPAWFLKDAEETEFGETSWALRRSRTIGRFRMDVKLVEDRDHDVYESGDTELDHENMKDIIAGNSVVCGVTVAVFDAEDDTELGGASLWGIHDNADLSYIRGEVIPDLLQEAKADARRKIARLSGRAA